MKVIDLTINDVKVAMADGSIIIIDVREPHEFAAGHIPGSMSLPLSQFDAALIPQAAGKRVVFSCAAGVRSVHAINAAQAAGLELNTHYLGGFRDWMMAGEAVEV